MLAVLLELLLIRLAIALPNIVLLITDDQDVALGSLQFMPNTLRAFRQRGVDFRNAFATTPICCPSRSSILTGLYAHNHEVMTNNGNCAGAEWRWQHENGTFAVHLSRAGYRTGYFGKYLNDYDGTWTPPGWSEWLGLVRNSRYYNYTLSRNGQMEWHGDAYEQDYLTDLIINESLHFMAQSFGQPFLAVLSFPAPHGPEDPAPQFADLFPGVTTHRTDSWNFAPNPDKQWLLQRTGKMEPIHVAFTDQAHRRRLQTLQSVDDAVQRLFQQLRELNLLHKTFVLYTSDHGYHLGQFGIVKGKAMPYDFDIRIPFMLRGPGLPRGQNIHSVVSNIDIAPTLLDMAGIPAPAYMDGRPLLELPELGVRKTDEPWRDTVLIERGKMPTLRRIRDRLQAQRARIDKRRRIARVCSAGKSAKYRVPCETQQRPSWRCVQDGRQWRVRRCPLPEEHRCECGRKGRNGREAEEEEEEEEMEEEEEEFLAELDQREVVESGQWYQGVFDIEEEEEDVVASRRNRRRIGAAPVTQTGKKRKKLLDNKIRRLRKKLAHFKHVRKSMKRRQRLKSTMIDECECRKARRQHPIKRLAHLPTVNNLSSSIGGDCHQPQMNCFVHSAEHWRTPPRWPPEFGQFCFCQNANNNSYWCARTVNATHNFLYCEFVTEEVAFFNLTEDPHQLINAVADQPEHLLEQLSAQLGALKACRGRAQCERVVTSHPMIR